MAVLAQHSATTVEHGTPHEVVALARHVFGERGIDCDPFSSLYWNRYVVKARVFCNEETNALSPACRWTRQVAGVFLDMPKFETYFINPPGQLVKEAWRFACARWCEGASVFWTGFSLEQLSYLQGMGLMWRGFQRVIPPRRLAFLRRPGDVANDLRQRIVEATSEKKARDLRRQLEQLLEQNPDPDGPPVRGASPTHANYLLLMPQERVQAERFDEAAWLMPAEAF